MIMIRVITITRTFKHDDGHNDGRDEDKSAGGNIESASILRNKAIVVTVNLAHMAALVNTPVYLAFHAAPYPT